MACDKDMRGLMEQLFPTLYYRFASNFIDIARPALFVPSESVTNDIFESMKIVLFTKRLLILKRWEKYFGISCLKAFSSHEMYLRYVMFACEIQAGLSDDIFDVILNVCALVLTFIIETLNNTGVNFCNLSVDIFMVFYEKNLKEPFCWLGGFQKFAAYLHEEYLQGGKYFNEDFEIPVTYRVSLQKNANNSIKEMFEKSPLDPDYITHDVVMSSLDCHVLATEVLSVTKKDLPPLPSQGELMLRIRDNRQKRAMYSKLKTAGTDSKKKSTGLNAKREEVFLAANVILPPLPNATGEDSECTMLESDSNYGTMVTLESLERQAVGTAKILKRKLAVMEKNLKPYTTYLKRILSTSELEREVVSRNSKGNMKASSLKRVKKMNNPEVAKANNSKVVAKSSDLKDVKIVSKPKAMKKPRDPKAVAEGSDRKTIVNLTEPKAGAMKINTKNEEPESDPKCVVKASESKNVMKLSDTKLFVKSGDTKVVKTSDPKFVVRVNYSKAQEKTSDLKAVAKVTESKVVVNSDTRNQVQASDVKAAEKASDPKAAEKACYSKAEAAAIDPKSGATASDPKALSKANDQKTAAQARDPKAVDNSIDSNSQAFKVMEQKVNIAWCENIVQRVIEYNNSNRPYPSETKKSIMKEVDETLEHLKSLIKSLIKVLDEYDEK